MPPCSVARHAPPEQTSPPPQARPQLPQLAWSARRSTHATPQALCPAAQVGPPHSPEPQLTYSAHPAPQAPQWALSVAKSTQNPAAVGQPRGAAGGGRCRGRSAVWREGIARSPEPGVAVVDLLPVADAVAVGVEGVRVGAVDPGLVVIVQPVAVAVGAAVLSGGGRRRRAERSSPPSRPPANRRRVARREGRRAMAAVRRSNVWASMRDLLAANDGERR